MNRATLRFIRPLAAALLLAPSFAFAATYYVAPNGSDTAGNGSSSAPWATIGHGVSRLRSGDTLIVRAGTYYGVENFINTRRSPIASGSPGAYTTIRAEQPYSVRIRNSGGLGYWDGMIQLGSQDSYIHIDGFIFDMRDTSYPEYIANIDGNWNKITRSIFRRTGNVNEYGGWVSVIGDFNLLEDCAGVGAARYGFITGGPDATSSNNIFRRCVGRIDYSNSGQPKATFAVYGNNSGHNVRQHLFQNCIAIDGRRGPSSPEDTYGGFYFPKNAAEVTIQGSIVLNNEAGHAGYFVKELQGRNIRVEHSIAWDIWGRSGVAGIRANGAGSGYLVFDHLTIGRSASPSMTGYYNQDSAPIRELTNSLFVNNTSLRSGSSYGWTTQTHNAFQPASQAEGANRITTNIDLKYLVRAEPGSALVGAATDGGDIGATILYRYGAPGTHWGQPGFDQLTTERLWPWPYEAQIKAVFAEPHNPPSGNVPSTNNTTRGFASTAPDPWGQPMTLTRYIWQYLGNRIPDSIYGTGRALPAPQGVQATVLH